MRDSEKEAGDAIMASILGDEDGVRRNLDKAILRAAVSRQCMCGCGQILDMRRDVLIEVQERDETLVAVVLCATCTSRALPRFQQLASLPGQHRVLKVYDGKQLYKSHRGGR